MARQRESLLGDRVDTWLKAQPDVFFFNVHGHAMQKKGIPDRVGTVGPIGFWVELKNPGEKPTPIQRAIANKIRRAGGMVRTCRSMEEVQEFIQELRVMALDRIGSVL